MQTVNAVHFCLCRHYVFGYAELLSVRPLASISPDAISLSLVEEFQ